MSASYLGLSGLKFEGGNLSFDERPAAEDSDVPEHVAPFGATPWAEEYARKLLGDEAFEADLWFEVPARKLVEVLMNIEAELRR
jgi:hypothetical protein